MPLIAKACLAYALGLFAAQTLLPGSASAILALSLLCGAVVLTTPSLAAYRELGSCCVLLAGGVLVGLGAREHAAACMGVLRSARVIQARLAGDAHSGALVRGRARYGECEADVALLVTSGSGAAGDLVLARGTSSAGERGLFLRDAVLSPAIAEPGAAVARARIGRRIDRLFGPDAPLVRALVIADMSGVPAEQRDRFARAGLVHMLSVSGLHVAIVALALELLASALRVPPLLAHVATLALLAGYVMLIGAPPPAVRAAVMLALFIASRMLQRPTSRWALLAVGGAVPLVQATVVTDLGWQLSVAGTIALVAGGALARRVIPLSWRGARRTLTAGATISVVATVVTAPLVAWTFGRLAVLGPITNLLADPVIGLLQPVLFLAICVPVAAFAGLMVDAAHLLIMAFDVIATRAAALPFAAPAVLPSALGACAAGIAATALVVACVARRPMRPALCALAALALMVIEPMVPRRRAYTELHMIDVGQGDAFALRTRAGHWVVIDAGRSWRGGDAGQTTVVPYLAHRGGSVALFILSHPHADHVGGAASLFDAMHPAAFLDPGYVGTTPPYLAALAAARRDRVPWRRVHPGDSLVVDEAVITALAPDSAWASTLSDPNLASTVASVRVGAVRFLFTGDAEGPEEDWLLDHAREALRADVLKVGHHGSSTSTTAPFLDAVRPRLALVSVGEGNSYGHPSASVMAELQASGAQVVRTDQLGSVVVRTDGVHLQVEARGTEWEVPAREPR